MELMFSDGNDSPWRLKMKSPSFANLQVLEFMMEGAMLGGEARLHLSMHVPRW
jgi:NADH:ubiquinone oxidoreductase subunit D